METSLPRQLDDARVQTDDLFAIVAAGSLYERPIAERHRIVFYLGHLEAFDWNLLARRALDFPSFHPTFDRLFAFGIDPGEGDLPGDQRSDWPSIEEIKRYNQLTREAIDRALPSIPDEMLHAAIEHRLMHAETLAYILHQLPYDRKMCPPAVMTRPTSPPRARMIDIAAGAAQLGQRPNNGFGWDNEYAACTEAVPAFSIGKYKVTNREYLEFVRAGGSAPLFWKQSGSAWFYRGMFDEYPLPLDAPVYVTKSQAEAYAKWRGAFALPTEGQFHRAADGVPPSQNLDFRFWDPIAVTADDNGHDTPMQMTGNGWEWTSSVFAPFPGFTPRPYYENYSAPFFDGEHYVLKGASPRTAGRFARPSFRNWFRPSYPYIYATFRLVQS